MTSHLHLFCKATAGFVLSDIIRDFKKFTSKKIIQTIIEDFKDVLSFSVWNIFKEFLKFFVGQAFLIRLVINKE
jgi:hypothetical protein